MSARRTTTSFPMIRHWCHGEIHDAWFRKDRPAADGLTTKCPRCKTVFVLAIPRGAPPMTAPPDMAL